MSNMPLMVVFQSTLPARGATRLPRCSRQHHPFQSTLPARGATGTYTFECYAELISIHAPRTGSDAETMNLQNRGGYFNPRSPHGERPAFLLMLHAHITFQSTLPARGATKSHKEYYISPHDFNPRSPHGERPHFSIFGIVSAKFQSTLPARGATLQLLQERAVQGISIHAPRTGSDALADLQRSLYAISIHAPRTGSDARA